MCKTKILVFFPTFAVKVFFRYCSGQFNVNLDKDSYRVCNSILMVTLLFVFLIIMPEFLSASPFGRSINDSQHYDDPIDEFMNESSIYSVAQSESVPIRPETALKALGVNIGVDELTDEFLLPDEAFILKVLPGTDNNLSVNWEIAETYYLYRNKFKFSLRNAPGGSLGEIVFPAGKIKDDPTFGKVEVFYNQVSANIGLHANKPKSTQVKLDITYQGCTERGLCYSPITKIVSIPDF